LTPGEFCITLICIVESSFLAWGWFCGGFRRVNIPPCSERLAYLEREVAQQREDLHALRSQLNPVVTWVQYQRAKEKRRKPPPED
jgi:hypothetical protein